MDSKLVEEIKQRLIRVKELAQEIEDVPNLLPDLWTMKGIDKKCQEIKEHAQWIEDRLDWGSGGSYDTWPSGTKKPRDW